MVTKWLEYEFKIAFNIEPFKTFFQQFVSIIDEVDE